MQHVRLGVEYIAFYGSKEKFDISGGIRYYAKIRNYRVYKRSECVEIPKNSDDLYIRFELDEIIEVGPIATVEYGLQTVMYTTLYLLQNAQNIHELKLKSREEIVLYKKLKSLSQQKGLALRRYRDYYTMDQVKIQLLDGRKIRIEKDIFTFKEGLKRMESIYG